MNKTRILVQVVGIAIIAGLLSASTPESPAVKPAQQSSLQVITITGADFIPREAGLDYFYNGTKLFMVSGSGMFSAPIHLPGDAVIKSLVLYANDTSSTGMIVANVVRVEPAHQTSVIMGWTITLGTDGVQTRTTWNINPQFISTHHETFVLLQIDDDTGNLDFYGVKIKYELR